MGWCCDASIFMLLTVTTAMAAVAVAEAAKRPHILVIVSDDIGNADYQDVDPFMRTPHLTALRKRGLLLTQSYTLQTCTPTRTALLTGKYPYRLGLSLGKIKGNYLRWLHEKQKLLPQSMKEIGYRTHMVGKWHLGYCHWNLTPMFRGFESFFGLYSGAVGYFNHSSMSGAYDFRDDHRVAWEHNGTDSTVLYTRRVQSIINSHTGNASLFIYLAYQNAHSPFEADPWYIDNHCGHVNSSEKRKIHCAMVAAMDDGIGNITATLKRKGIENDTLILYLSDNGGPLGHGSYNWPLRGGKSSFWEGGTRQRTIFVYPNGLKPQLVGTEYDGLVHVTDWYKTLYAAGRGNMTLLHEMDSINQYNKLVNGETPSARREMIYNIDTYAKTNRSAVRLDDHKYIRGHAGHSRWLSAAPAPPDMELNGTATSVEGIYPDEALFNVREDPGERNNLIEEAKTNCTLGKILAELRSVLYRELPNVIPFPDHIPKNPMGNARYYSGAKSPGWCCLDEQQLGL
ncbi:arylsulfatase J-like [Babylonia areolata]|uniref:arylsulfatase J-like n=1 Tax=Babylonia areolata TaxID=304850 RepID=UPI003FD0971F